MTIPMDNTSDNISRERAQRLYNKNVELENRRRKAAQARVPSDPNSWQQMRENYEAIVLEDHAFSEQHEIEHALWQLHYRRIEELRGHFNAALASASHNGKGPARPGPDRVAKIRSQFKTFLSEATGFYHDLMVKIRAKYGLPLSHFSDDPGYQNGFSKDGNRSVEVKKGLISCHRCLIYLGDLARYKGLYGDGDSKARDFAAATSYYMQASSIWPSSGNPHHQLAILASYSGDELVAVYRYFRSLAVDTPFTTARDNLIIAFEKNRQTYSQFLGDVKPATVKPAPVRMTGKGRGKGEIRVPIKDSKAEEIPVKEKVSTTLEIFKAFGIRFVRLNGILFTRTSLETFGEVFSCAKNDLLGLLSSGPDEEYNFGPNAADCGLLIVRLVAILIFTVHNVNRETENQSYAEILQRSVVLKNAFTAIFEFIGHIIERCIQLTDPSSSYFLPGILIFLEWLACRQDVAVNTEPEEREGSARSFFWNQCVTFFNRLLKSGFMFGNEDEDEACFYNMSRYEEGETANHLALTEDFELRGFTPLVPAQLILDFSRKHSFGNDGGNKEKKVRIQRIIAAGKALANSVRVGQQRFYFDSKLKRFSIGVEPNISDDYPLAEKATLNDMGQENLNLVVPQTTMGVLQPNAHMFVEGEEEDEVILFKPSVTEKTAIRSGVSASMVDAGTNFGSVSASHDNILLQNSLDAVSRPPPLSLSEISAHYMQPLQQSTSKWLAEEQSSITNGFADLNLFEFQDHTGGLQPTAVTVPFPQTISIGTGNRYPFQVSETVVPSKFDSVMSSGGGTDILYMKPPSAATSVGLKKNPVGRPIRHFGPPPGFNAVPHKPLDESLSGANLNNVKPPLDDYSWLDGHKFPSTMKPVGFNNSAYHPVSKSNDAMGVVSFPFPGKQVSAFQPQMENHNGWQEYQFSEHLKLYQQQQQQLQNGNQHSVSVPQQYQGQTLWEGRFV